MKLMFSFSSVFSWIDFSKRRKYSAKDRKKLIEWGKREYLRTKENALKLMNQGRSDKRTSTLKVAIFLCKVYQDKETAELLQEALDQEEQ